jgi:hypothetical protein
MERVGDVKLGSGVDPVVDALSGMSGRPGIRCEVDGGAEFGGGDW